MAAKLLPIEACAEQKMRLPDKEIQFKVAFAEKLENKFEIKDMTERHVKEFHRFISETVYKKLTISQVEALYLRKEGLSNAPKISYNDKEIVHFGKDRNPFRLFGYYSQNGYFVVCRIDGNHKTHKS